MSMNFCEIYTSPVSKSSGPWNGSMCSTKLKQIQCPKGKIKGCMPLVFGDLFFAACIKKFEDLKGTLLCPAVECIYKHINFFFKSPKSE